VYKIDDGLAGFILGSLTWYSICTLCCGAIWFSWPNAKTTCDATPTASWKCSSIICLEITSPSWLKTARFS